MKLKLISYTLTILLRPYDDIISATRKIANSVNLKVLWSAFTYKVYEIYIYIYTSMFLKLCKFGRSSWLFPARKMTFISLDFSA